MLYNLFASPRYEKDVALAKKRGLDIDDLISVVEKLQKGEKLERKHKDHPLHGKHPVEKSDLMIFYMDIYNKFAPVYFKTSQRKLLIICNCGGYRTRTGHLKIANLTLYQMS